MKINKYIILFLFMANNIIYSQSIQLACLKKDYNAIQFKDSNVLSTFNSSWNSKKRFSVLHLGDSHLQNENLTNKCRQLVQELMGDGGIGLVQPFSIVNTYDASFYKSTHQGIWEFSKSYILPPKLPLGVRGMTAKTLDEKATFKVTFKSPVSSQNSILSVFFQDTDDSYEPIFMADSIPAILISKSAEISKYKLPSKYSSIQLSLNKTNEKQNQFIMYGMSLSNTEDVAAKWHNAGVGACQYKSVLFEEKYMEQAAYLNPDLVIIDYGTNDFLYTNSISDQLKNEIQQVISKVKKANPRASVILTSAQDMNYKKMNVTASKLFSEMIKSIAYENECGFWDWYIISGGSNSMNTWQENKLTMNDGIHLNGKGSELKGILLIEALKNTISYLKNSTENRELNYEYPKEIEPIKEDAIAEIKQPINVISKTIKKTYYTVKSGDNLGQIAEKFKVSINKLKKQNKLRGNLIFPKQKLLIK